MCVIVMLSRFVISYRELKIKKKTKKQMEKKNTHKTLAFSNRALLMNTAMRINSIQRFTGHASTS